MARLLRLALAWPLLVVGLIVLPMPIPLGVPFIAIALALLVHDSLTLRRWMQNGRRRFPGIDAKLRAALGIRWLPGIARRMVDLTDPRHRDGI